MIAHWPKDAFCRIDESPDSRFYQIPRFVQHLDDDAIAAVTQIYRNHIRPGSDVLDLMSSWVSHLPADADYHSVVGLGMNREELQANPRLDEFVVHDLNEDPQLPFQENQFDAVVNCVSIDYLIHPVAVLTDLGRVVRPEGSLVIAFSNRCFPSKAIKIWLEASERGRCLIVERFVDQAGCWTDIHIRDLSPHLIGGDPIFALTAKRQVTSSDPSED